MRTRATASIIGRFAPWGGVARSSGYPSGKTRAARHRDRSNLGRQREGAIAPERVVEDAVLVAFVLIVVATDWRWRRIPNVVTYPAMLAGLALGAWEGVPGTLFGGGLLDHAAGLAIALAVTYPVYAARGLKAGDVKLLMAVGALRGTAFLLSAALFGALAGGIVALAFMAARRASRARPSLNALLHSWIPYGVALGAGVLVALAFEFAVA